MAVLTITRNQYLDRACSIDELTALVEMLRVWYLTATGSYAAKAELYFQARIYAFARPEAQSIFQALSVRLPETGFNFSDPDEMVLDARPQSVDRTPDTSMWREVLGEPLLANACLRFQITMNGRMISANGKPGEGTTSLIICGMPNPAGMLVKSVWRLGSYENEELLYRFVAWRHEKKLIEAFDFYLEQCVISPPESAASLAWKVYKKTDRFFFTTKCFDTKVRTLAGYMVELPDARGPSAFVRRLGIPLLIGGCLVLLPLRFETSVQGRSLCFVLASGMFLAAARVVWVKIRYIRRLYAGNRRSLGMLYANPIKYELVDLSKDQTPTLLKYSRELGAVGQQVCDVSIATARAVFDSNRVYVIENTIVQFGLLRKYQKLDFFPARPILMISTRFKDGRSHATMNVAKYRKTPDAGDTLRCLIDEGSVEELLISHHRHVKSPIGGGAVPIPPPRTGPDVLEWMRKEGEDDRARWTRAPYSWSDAIHQGFKVCRREYLQE